MAIERVIKEELRQRIIFNKMKESYLSSAHYDDFAELRELLASYQLDDVEDLHEYIRNTKWR